MPKGILLLVVISALGACSTEMSCSDPGRLTSGPDSLAIPKAQAAWSPDGKTIAVAWAGLHTARRHGIYLINTADWTVDTLLIADDERSTPFFKSPAWSATGEWLAFAASAQIYKIKANGDSLTQLTNTSRQWYCDWSDSDTLIAYNITIGDSTGIWLMDAKGQKNKYVIRHGFDPFFTAGDSILFLAHVPGSSDSAHFSLLNIVDSTTRRVYAWKIGSPFSYYYNPKVSPDDQCVVLRIEFNIWTMTIEGKNLRQLTSDGGDFPNWSPDGSKIIYCKPSFRGGTLWIMNADGTGKTHIEGW